MPFLITFIALIITVIVVYYAICKKIQNKHEKFVRKNSVHLKKLQEINCKYKFYKHVDFNQTYSYDNETMFSEIDCVDYLTYQLQYISSNVITQINREKQNAKNLGLS